MSTYCAVHIKTSDRQSVINELQRYLALNHAGRVIHTTTTDSFGKLYKEEFICSETQSPTKFALFAEQSDWFTAHYNSFYPLRELAADISRKLDTVAIIVIAQSVSSGYYLGVYSNGEHLRTIEFADGEWLRREGIPLPFEPSPLGRNICAEGEEPRYWFEDE